MQASSSLSFLPPLIGEYPYWPRGDYAITVQLLGLHGLFLARVHEVHCEFLCWKVIKRQAETMWGEPLIATFLWCSVELGRPVGSASRPQ